MFLLVIFTFVCTLNLASPQILSTVFEPKDLVFNDNEVKLINVTMRVASTNQSQHLLVSTGYAKIAEAGFVTSTSTGVNTTKLTVPSAAGNFTFVVQVEGRRLGKTPLIIQLMPEGSNNGSYVNNQFILKVLRAKGVLDTLFQVFIIIISVLMTLCIGAALDIQIIVAMLKRPVGPGIGFFCQFAFMPCISFAITRIVSMDPSFGLGLLTIGCSPGGGGSNMWTALLDGDLNLSMTMTFLSNIAAMGMMPLWLFIFGRYFLDFSEIEIPYYLIAGSLMQILVPCVVGLILRRFKPNIADQLSKGIKPMAIIFLVFILSFGSYVNLYVYILFGDYPQILPIGACLPWTGFVAGAIMAAIFQQGKKKIVTIALETGYQNIAIAIVILLYSMPQPDGELGGIMPVVVAIFTPMPLYFSFLGLLIYKRFFKKNKVDEKEGFPSSVENEDTEKTEKKEEDAEEKV